MASSVYVCENLPSEAKLFVGGKFLEHSQMICNMDTYSEIIKQLDAFTWVTSLFEMFLSLSQSYNFQIEDCLFIQVIFTYLQSWLYSSNRKLQTLSIWGYYFGEDFLGKSYYSIGLMESTISPNVIVHQCSILSFPLDFYKSLQNYIVLQKPLQSLQGNKFTSFFFFFGYLVKSRKIHTQFNMMVLLLHESEINIYNLSPVSKVFLISKQGIYSYGVVPQNTSLINTLRDNCIK